MNNSGFLGSKLRAAILFLLASSLGTSLTPTLALSMQSEPIFVDLELVLAIDASGSVSADEFALQIMGFAEAFRDGEVIAAIQAVGDRGIAVIEIQWASPSNQLIAVGWTHLQSRQDALAFADRIEQAGRVMHGETAIRQAMSFGRTLIETNEFIGCRRVIDISGDGPTNYGTPPDSTRDELVGEGYIINGLAIENEFPDLATYYRDHVIGGAGSFVMTAADYGEFSSAIKAKLQREILGCVIS
jgi:hypothetical protein